MKVKRGWLVILCVGVIILVLGLASCGEKESSQSVVIVETVTTTKVATRGWSFFIPTAVAGLATPESVEPVFEGETLPRFPGAEIIHQDSSSLIYMTSTEMAQVTDFSRRELVALGWQEIVISETQPVEEANLGLLTFTKDGNMLTIFITAASEGDNQTTVQYVFIPLGDDLAGLLDPETLLAEITPQMLPPTATPTMFAPLPTSVKSEPTATLTPLSSTTPPDLPTPADAQELVYDPETSETNYISPSEIETLVKFYRHELSAQGWQEDEIVALVNPAIASLKFTKEKSVLALKMSNNGVGGKTSVNLSLSQPR